MYRSAGLSIAAIVAAIASDARAEVKPSNLLRVRSASISGPPPAPRAARPYAEAKRLLARGQPALALKALTASKSKLLADREALVRADALLALGNKARARAAFEAALDGAKIASVAITAARGLVNVHGQLDQPADQLRYLDALLDTDGVSRRPNLLLQKATVLDALGRRKEAARWAWHILQKHPTAKIAGDAQALLERLAEAGVPRPATTAQRQLARIKRLAETGAPTLALHELDALAEEAPGLEIPIKLQRATIFARQRRRAEEEALLLSLKGRRLSAKQAATRLERLGRIAMGRGDNESAIRYFDGLARELPRSPRAPEVQYLAAWLPYNSGDHLAGARRLLRFARTYGKWSRRPEALWFAAWSAHLGGDDGVARRAFDQLLDEHPSSDMIRWAHYWTGRFAETAGDLRTARRAYRELLKIAPLSYFGHWSIIALERLGEQIVFDAPPPAPRVDLRKAIEAIGRTRPINLDRGMALSAAGMSATAIQELRAASRALRKVKKTRTRVLIAELIGSLGAHHQAFRLAAAVARDGGDLVSGRPYAWRAWRLAYPKAFWKDVEAAAKVHEVDPFLVLSIMRTESHFRPHVTSRVGARGLMQIMPKTARRIGRKAKGGRGHAARYKRPRSNIWLGAWYIARLLERYDGNIAMAAGAYNAGPGAMDRWIRKHGGMDVDAFVESLSYRETRRYIRRVLETYWTYRRLEGLPHLDLTAKVEPIKPPEGSVSF